MTSFGWWADRVPHGQFLCCVCFDVHPLTKAATDDDGDRVDTCTDCWEAER